MSNGKKKLAYAEFLSNLANLLCNSLKFEKEGKMLKSMEEKGCDKKPFYDEAAYLQIFALFTAIRKKCPDSFEKIIEDLEKAIFESEDASLQDLKLKLESKVKLQERILDYTNTWNEALGRAKKIKDNSWLNDPIFTISKKASINAYGEKEGMDIRIIIAFSSKFMCSLEGFTAYLEGCKVIE